jgi:hypothetical protein
VQAYVVFRTGTGRSFWHSFVIVRESRTAAWRFVGAVTGLPGLKMTPTISVGTRVRKMPKNADAAAWRRLASQALTRAAISNDAQEREDLHGKAAKYIEAAERMQDCGYGHAAA